MWLMYNNKKRENYTVQLITRSKIYEEEHG